ncbi:MAG: type II toxin-antitoxin system PemK/MazF family toxin, partial [Mycobacterium sp.]
MASQWKTFQRLAETAAKNLVFNEAPKFIRQLQRPENLPRGIQQGIKIGLDVLTGTADESQTAITAGRPVTKNSVPTAHRARKLVYAPDLDGRADPGEVVWTWVVYEDDPSQGKDRPVLVVGRDRRTLLGLMLSSQER